jgi:hypothetical protein
LRVWNCGKHTLWIGSDLPYGGNYIKPGMYVEFYPHRVAWLRIRWCRYSWYKKDVWDTLEPWYNNNMYDCRSTDVLVNEHLETIGVK